MRIEMMACIAALDFGCRKSWQVPYVRAFWQSALKLGNDVCIIWLVPERRLVLKRHRPHLPERRFDNPCLSHDYRSSSHFKPYVRPNVTPCCRIRPGGGADYSLLATVAELWPKRHKKAPQNSTRQTGLQTLSPNFHDKIGKMEI